VIQSVSEEIVVESCYFTQSPAGGTRDSCRESLIQCYYAKIQIYLVLNETIVIVKVSPLFQKSNYNLITTFFDVTVTNYSYWIFVS